MKSRRINSKIRLSQSFSGFTYRQRDLWHGLIVCADDQGRLPGHPAAVRSMVWPYDDLSLNEISNDLVTLEANGCIVLYSVGDVDYIQIVNWWKYQKMQWAGASEYPSPDGWLDRLRYHGSGRKIIKKNWDTPGGFYLAQDDKDKVKDRVNVKDKVKDNDNDNARLQSKTTKVDDKGSRGVFEYYEQNIGPLTPSIAERIGDAIEEYENGWITEAIDIACENNIRKWSYVKAILENWEVDGKDSKRKQNAQQLGGEYYG